MATLASARCTWLITCFWGAAADAPVSLDGKDKVRVLRVVRNADGTHDIAEYIVRALLEGYAIPERHGVGMGANPSLQRDRAGLDAFRQPSDRCYRQHQEHNLPQGEAVRYVQPAQDALPDEPTGPRTSSSPNPLPSS